MSVERYRGLVDDWTAFTEALSRPEPQVLRIRPGSEDVLASLKEQGFSLRAKPGLSEFHEVVEGPKPLSATIEHWLGRFYIQRASTGVAASALVAEPGGRVLDLCAAPGGKTGHLAELVGRSGCVVANEANEGRVRGLLGNVYRLGLTNVAVTVGDGRSFPDPVPFDRVLADVPCSGEGTARRRGGKMPHVSRSYRNYAARAQRALLSRAIHLTKPGGTVLYVTCTFAPEENEAVVADALERAPVKLDPLDLAVPHTPGLTSFEGVDYGPDLEGTVRIYPHHLDSGGLFLARLVKLDDGNGATGPPDTGESRVAPLSLPRRGEQDTAEVESMIALAEDDLLHRFEVPPHTLSDLRWMHRGGRLWLHTMPRWPFTTWFDEGHRSHRIASVGLRAMEFDSRGRPRPTNDLLRWLGRAVASRVVEVPGDRLERLLNGDPLPLGPDAQLGPVALRHGRDVIGRGAATRHGLKSEIPRARAADLRRILGYTEEVPVS